MRNPLRSTLLIMAVLLTISLGMIGLKLLGQPQGYTLVYSAAQAFSNAPWISWYVCETISRPMNYLSYPVADGAFSIVGLFGSETLFLGGVALLMIVEAVVVFFLARRGRQQLPPPPP